VIAPVNPDLPSLADVCPEVVVEALPCSGEDLSCSSASPGYTLPTGWDDPVYDYNGNGIRIMGRLKNKLAAFKGSGFLKLVNGLAYVVDVVPLRVSSLWHQWFKPAGINKRPILGVPLPFKNQVMADELGNLYGIKGLTGEGVTTDSSHYYDRELEQWDTREDADIPLLKRGLLPTATAIELVGFVPIATSGAATDVRELKAFSGSGIVVVNQQATIPSSCDCDGCEPVAAVASVATFLPFPTGEGAYSLKVAVDGDGVPTPAWVEDD
jgi:hypothetical protein